MNNDSTRATNAAADQPATADYRESHLKKGTDYDTWLGASPFDAYMARWERYWLTRFVHRAYPSGIARYLDFACGTGRITATVAPFARETVGVDISPSMIDVARSKCPGVSFVQTDLTQQKSDLGTFDLITSFRFFGNAQDELRVAALRAIAGLLNPSGYLVINSHRNPSSLASLLHSFTGGNSEMDLHYFKLKRLLDEHDLRIVYARAIGFWMFRSRMLGSVYSDKAADRLERLFRWPVFAPFAPDSFLVAQKSPLR
jgi:ubiquinone/menaquinone biosynthesis C-methylase UbiE